MSDPAELMGVARQLHSHPAPPTDAQLRRAVSTAYYAVFHTILRAALWRFLGPGSETRPAFGILYRSFDHRHVRTVCLALQSTTLPERYRRVLLRPYVSQDMRDFAYLFPELQNHRHLADYDPMTQFVATDVLAHIETAESAIAAFDRVPLDEKTDVLALMMVRARD